MKKLLLIISILLIASISYAVVDYAVSKALTTSYAVVKDTSKIYNQCVPISVWTEDGTAFYIAQDAAGTGVKYIPADSFYSNDCVKISSDGTIMWAKAAAAIPTLYVDIGRSN
jgi:hypothetical protein